MTCIASRATAMALICVWPWLACASLSAAQSENRGRNTVSDTERRLLEASDKGTQIKALGDFTGPISSETAHKLVARALRDQELVVPVASLLLRSGRQDHALATVAATIARPETTRELSDQCFGLIRDIQSSCSEETDVSWVRAVHGRAELAKLVSATSAERIPETPHPTWEVREQTGQVGVALLYSPDEIVVKTGIRLLCDTYVAGSLDEKSVFLLVFSRVWDYDWGASAAHEVMQVITHDGKGVPVERASDHWQRWWWDKGRKFSICESALDYLEKLRRPPERDLPDWLKPEKPKGTDKRPEPQLPPGATSAPNEEVSKPPVVAVFFRSEVELAAFQVYMSMRRLPFGEQGAVWRRLFRSAHASPVSEVRKEALRMVGLYAVLPGSEDETLELLLRVATRGKTEQEQVSAINILGTAPWAGNEEALTLLERILGDDQKALVIRSVAAYALAKNRAGDLDLARQSLRVLKEAVAKGTTESTAAAWSVQALRRATGKKTLGRDVEEWEKVLTELETKGSR